MRRPSPEILDIFYRSGGYPIDDLDVRDVVQHTSSVYASTWFVPTRTIPAVFFIMGGGSGDLSALIYELRRLAEITALTASALNWSEHSRTLARGLCYHYYILVTHLDARVHSKSIEVWDEALTPLVHASVLHPWFQPSERYEDVYRVGYIQPINLPIVDFDMTEEASFLGDPDAPVAKRADVKELRAAQNNKGLANPPLEKETDVLGSDFAGGEQSVQKLSDMRLSKEDREFLDLPDVEDDL
jgi:hypothetical protein